LSAEFAALEGCEIRRVGGSAGSAQLAGDWMRKFKPQAFACSCDVVAFRLMDTLAKIGVAVPGDVMVTGFDGVPSESEHAGKLTTIAQPLAEIGSTAIARLVERVRNRSLSRCTILLDAPLVVRESTKAKAKGM